jgi:hypothetical protein
MQRSISLIVGSGSHRGTASCIPHLTASLNNPSISPSTTLTSTSSWRWMTTARHLTTNSTADTTNSSPQTTTESSAAIPAEQQASTSPPPRRVATSSAARLLKAQLEATNKSTPTWLSKKPLHTPPSPMLGDNSSPSTTATATASAAATSKVIVQREWNVLELIKNNRARSVDELLKWYDVSTKNWSQSIQPHVLLNAIIGRASKLARQTSFSYDRHHTTSATIWKQIWHDVTHLACQHSNLTGREVANLLHSMATLGCEETESHVVLSLLDQVPRTIHTFGGQEISNALHALATMNTRSDIPIRDAVAKNNDTDIGIAVKLLIERAITVMTAESSLVGQLHDHRNAVTNDDLSDIDFHDRLKLIRQSKDARTVVRTSGFNEQVSLHAIN